jgi:hypothetical protein
MKERRNAFLSNKTTNGRNLFQSQIQFSLFLNKRSGFYDWISDLIIQKYLQFTLFILWHDAWTPEVCSQRSTAEDVHCYTTAR